MQLRQRQKNHKPKKQTDTGNATESSFIIRTDHKVFSANVGCLVLAGWLVLVCDTAALKPA